MTDIRIPETDGVSGTFAALERTTPIVQVAEGVATTTSMRIANGTQNEHPSVLRLIRDNLADFEEFGLVGFEIAPRPAGQHGGGDVTVAILNEDHATLLLTFMRNNEIVKDFKKRLVREFSALRRQLATPMSDDEIMHQALAISTRRIGALTERVAELEPKAEFYDELMDADGTYSFLKVAKMIGWGRNTMMRDLRRAGVLQRNNLPYRRFEHHFKVTPQTYTNRKTGETVPTATTSVWPSGIEFIRRKLAAADAAVGVDA